MNKVRSFAQVSKEERAKIEVLLKKGFSLREIGRSLGRPACTISRELKRNGPLVYRFDRAQHFTELRHRQKNKRIVFTAAMKEFIVEQLRTKRLSPELICRAGKQIWSAFISAEWIYKWIWQMKFSMAKADRPYQRMYKYLRNASRKGRRGRKRSMRGNIIDRKWIEQRPAAANNRSRCGHLEADIMLGKDRQPGLLVMLDRKSRKSWLKKLVVKDADYVIERCKEICQQAGKVKTITFDNDQSFAEHYKLRKIGIKTYFTHPYSSQEKGSVENRIGIIRMFFPKKTNFRNVKDEQVHSIQELLNQRPLRMFNYKTPNEKHNILTL